ncbi:hypothetical protein [Formosa haliotis]|uniref:hypothetical protein n=1 Tax=Formosa haliotis TaxID=1555194 RepID=UPI00114643A4|nr:hypothetical protein [Formosa haliotis]
MLVISKPIILMPDSEGYLNMDLYRSAGYPLFIFLIHSVFGSFFNLATIIIQYTLGVTAITFFISTLKKQTSLHYIWLILLNGILLIPYVYNHKLSNVILSEALAYPLYLIVVSFFIQSLFQTKVKPILLSLPFLLMLIQTRSQFLFLVPIAIGLLLWVWFKHKTFNNKWLLIVLVLFPFICGFTDKAFHKIVHGYFVSTPWTGIHLLTPAFFVADNTDFSLFTTEIEQTFYKNTYADLAEKHLNIHEFDAELNHTDELATYIADYAEIANFTILPNGITQFPDSLTDDEKLIEVDQLTKQMALPLVLDNFKPWLRLYIKNFVYAFGNAKYVLLLFILIFWSAISCYKSYKPEHALIFFIAVLSFSNVALIATGMHTIKRFTFYNDWVLFLIIFLLINTKNTFNKSLK